MLSSRLSNLYRMDCKVCSSLPELLSLKPDILVEAASPAALKEIAIPTLNAGSSIVALSIGALADTELRNKVVASAAANRTRVYVASGATGGFEVLQTISLMGEAQAQFFNEKGPEALRGTSVYDDGLLKEGRTVYSGTAEEAIKLFPTRVNVTVAASLASVGPERMEVKMVSTPGFKGDTQRVEISNDQVRAVVDVYSSSSDIAGWSVVRTLRNIVSPIVF